MVRRWYYTDRLQARGAGRRAGGGKTGRTQRQEKLLQVRLSVVLRSRRESERTRPSFWRGPGQQSRVPQRSELVAVGDGSKGNGVDVRATRVAAGAPGPEGRCAVKAAAATFAPIGRARPIEDDEEF